MLGYLPLAWTPFPPDWRLNGRPGHGRGAGRRSRPALPRRRDPSTRPSRAGCAGALRVGGTEDPGRRCGECASTAGPRRTGDRSPKWAPRAVKDARGQRQDHHTLRHRRAQAESGRVLELRTCGIGGSHAGPVGSARRWRRRPARACSRPVAHTVPAGRQPLRRRAVTRRQRGMLLRGKEHPLLKNRGGSDQAVSARYGIVCGPSGRTQTRASGPDRESASTVAAPTSSIGVRCAARTWSAESPSVLSSTSARC